MKKSVEVATWQLQTAKNRFSEVVERARTQGPQIVTRHGSEAVVVLGIDDYHQLLGKKKPARSFIACLLEAPKTPGGLVVERSRDPGRSVEFE